MVGAGPEALEEGVAHAGRCLWRTRTVDWRREEEEGEEADGGGALGDAAELVKACLRVDVSARPTFQTILQSRFLSGKGGWGLDS